jgi:hypothetical protein
MGNGCCCIGFSIFKFKLIKFIFKQQFKQ